MTSKSNVLSIPKSTKKPESKFSLNDIFVKISKGFSFTEEHLQQHLKLHNHDRYPDIYNGDSPEGVNYDITDTVSMENIESDSEFRSQSVRAKNNPEEPAIRSSILTEGYDLGELPIALIKVPGGKFKVAEGRTRLGILKQQEVKNIIADIFEPMSETAYVRFGNFYNAKKHPFGKADFLDIRKGVLKVMESKCSKEDDTKEVIRQTDIEIAIQSNGKLTKNQSGEIHTQVQKAIYGSNTILSFPNGDGAGEWLIKNHYLDGVNREINKHIIYVHCASLIEKFHTRVRKLDEKYHDNDADGFPYEIRLVIHGGVLDSKNFVDDWNSKCLQFKKDLRDYEKDISELIFKGAKPNMKDKFVLYGSIPMLEELSDKYPMGKIVQYK